MRVRVSAFLLIASLAASASAQIQGIGYRLTPSAAYVDFDDGAGLSDGLFYGGGVGFSFGEFVELGGSFQLGSFDTDVSGLTTSDGTPLALPTFVAREVDVQRYGGALKLNLLPTAVVPFVTGGTGVVRLAPDGLEATRSIYLLGGAGVQFTAFDRFGLSIAAEDFVYRYDPASALLTAAEVEASGVSPEAFGQTTVHNLGVRVAANVYLGGRRPGELSELDRSFQRQFSGGLSGLSLVVEPFYGRVAFDDAFSYRDQAFVGAEAGFDFGPLVGIRGFYARGTSASNPLAFESVQMIGGDLRLRLSEGRGIVPFLTVGGGYLNVLEGYASDEGAEPQNAFAEDSPFAAGGGGIGFLVTPRLRALVEVRGLLMSTQDEADLSAPEDVYLSPMYRAGVSFGLGGRAGRGDATVVRQSDLDAERATMEAERAALAASRDSLRADIARLEALRQAEAAAAVEREAALRADLAAQLEAAQASGDSLAVARLEAEQLRLDANRTSDEIDGLVAEIIDEAAMEDVIEIEEIEMAPEAEHMVTIPLPREGELYVRYGPPGGVLIDSGVAPGPSEADLRATVRAAIAEVLAERDPDAPTLTDDDVAALEARIVARLAPPRPPASGVTQDDLDALEQRLEERLIQALREALADPQD